MNLPVPNIHRKIDGLVQSHASFALYRLPWTDEPILVMQEGQAESLENLSALNGKRGFVLSPFRAASPHPTVLIRPETVVRQWENIGEMLDACKVPAESVAENQPCGIASDPSDDGEAKETYVQAFRRFIVPLQEKVFHKLVLSRKASQTLAPDFSPLTAFVRACNSYPRMMVSLCHTPQTGTWIGSTPEIILSGHGDQWHTVALAGTMPVEGGTVPAEWSQKNHKEQEFVCEYIRRTVKGFGTNLKENGPYTARAGQVVHLKTDFRFSLKDTKRLGNILNTLHPTPAVCGLPKEETYEFIADNEGYDRSYYAGIIGWLDPQGETSLYVNLRCMNISGTCATLYAGGGILPQSTAETEWEETLQKMNTMRNIL